MDTEQIKHPKFNRYLIGAFNVFDVLMSDSVITLSKEEYDKLINKYKKYKSSTTLLQKAILLVRL